MEKPECSQVSCYHHSNGKHNSPAYSVQYSMDLFNKTNNRLKKSPEICHQKYAMFTGNSPQRYSSKAFDQTQPQNLKEKTEGKKRELKKSKGIKQDQVYSPN